MRFIDNRNITDPTLNLALEEYALKAVDIAHDHLLFYVNEPAVIIGKHQNTAAEINAEFIEENNIHVVRRISGGGAVYHDHGNLNFSFITQASKHRFHRYESFLRPVVAALQTLGVPADLNGRNDIVVGDKKISGNAQYQLGNRMFCHGTVLVSSALEDVVAALNVNPDKIISKGIQSIRSRVANINEYLAEPISVDQLKKHFIASFASQSLTRHQLSEADWEKIHELANTKYRSWDWNYGKSPRCNIQNRKRFSIGEIAVNLFIESGKIESVKFFGDFFAKREISELEAQLVGVQYDHQSIETKLNTINLEDYFGLLDKDDFISLLVL